MQSRRPRREGPTNGQTEAHRRARPDGRQDREADPQSLEGAGTSRRSGSSKHQGWSPLRSLSRVPTAVRRRWSGCRRSRGSTTRAMRLSKLSTRRRGRRTWMGSASCSPTTARPGKSSGAEARPARAAPGESPRDCPSRNPPLDEEAQRSFATGAFHELIDRVQNIGDKPDPISLCR